MPRNVRRTRVSRETSSRRKWVWARHDVINTTVAAGTTSFADLLSEFETSLGSDLLGVTVMRIRGEFKTDQSAMVAARIWNEPADGVTSLTTANHGPANGGRNHDWFWFQSIFLDVTTGVRVVEVDVKASRKMEELGQSLLIATHNFSASTMTYSWNLSIGLKLP